MGALAVSQRRACKTLGQVRSSQRHESRKRNEEDAARMRIIALAKEYGRYGYRMNCAMMRMEDWKVNHKYVYRVWREEGLKVPSKQPKRALVTDASSGRSTSSTSIRMKPWRAT
jgi:putative transposase